MTARVLVVDDSLTVRMDLAEALGAAGFSVTPAESARAARDALAETPHALVVLDVVLPDGDGLDFLRELRSGTSTASIR